MKTIAFFNLKGGVGKTAGAVNTAYYATMDGYSTVLWDLDAQGAASWYLLGERQRQPGLEKIWSEKAPISKVLKESPYENLDVIGSAFSNRNADVLLSELGLKRMLLKRLAAPLAENYDLLVLDCPPSLSRLTEQIFHACDAVVMPVIPTPLSLRAYTQVRDFMDKAGRPDTPLLPYYSMVDRRKRLHREWLESPPKELKKRLKTYIPYASNIEQMGLRQAPVGEFAFSDVGGQALYALWQEIEKKLK
ncbi:MAG: ParA family protein [Lysobacterales bacterium]